MAWEEVPRRGMQGPRNVEGASHGVLEQTRCEIGEGNSRISSHRVSVAVGEVVVGSLQEEQELVEWEELYVGREEGGQRVRWVGEEGRERREGGGPKGG